MSETVALATAEIARPNIFSGIEVTIARPQRRRFPPRLSETLGLCLKAGPAHQVWVDGRELSYPADALCVRAPGCVWECTTDVDGFVSIDIPTSFFADRAVGARGMRFARSGRVPNLDVQAQMLLAADSALLVQELVTDLLEQIERLDGLELVADEPRPRAVERARDLMHAAFASRLDLETIAGAAGLNKFSLVRQFRDALGTTPHAYVVMLRVNRARELLAAGSSPADVALEVGFSDQAHMTRWFLRVCGVTPAGYVRQVLRQDGSISFKTCLAPTWQLS
jgi:AraC-like DNA-binding protein